MPEFEVKYSTFFANGGQVTCTDVLSAKGSSRLAGAIPADTAIEIVRNVRRKMQAGVLRVVKG